LKTDDKLLKATAAWLRNRTARTLFQKVKGHSGVAGNEGADHEADRGARKDIPSPLNLDALLHLTTNGASMSSMTQAKLYKGIIARKPRKPRPTTEINVDRTQEMAELNFNYRPTAKRVWKSSHNAYRLGSYWYNIPDCKNWAICHTCADTETMDHILADCEVSGQKEIWVLEKQL